MTALAGSYDPRLVALSVVIAVLAAGAALDLAGRVTAASGRARALWLAGGACAMGLGIWSMHYTGMLAFRLPVPVRDHIPTVALSLVAAMFASAVALYVASRERLSVGRTIAGSLVMGSGIATMHYTGMAAMRLPAEMHWNAVLVTLSVIIAIVVSAVALWLAFRYGHAGREAWGWRKAGSALLMGAAVPCMHYTGMAAATFSGSDVPVNAAQTIGIGILGAYAIGAGTLLAMAVAISTSVIDRRFAAMHHAVRQGRELLTAVVEGSGEVIFAKDLTGRYLLVSRVTSEILRRAPEEMMGQTDAELFAPGLAQRMVEVDQRIAESGQNETSEESTEVAGETRTLLFTKGAIKDGTGKITGVFGAGRDITARKRAEEKLQTMLHELQAALHEVKTLRGLVTVCSNCRKVLNDEGTWQQIESYVRDHSEAEFSHGFCPTCAQVWEAEAGV